MLAIVHEYGPQLHTAEAARCSAEAALRSVCFQFRDVSVFESSMQEEVNQLQLDKSHLEDHCNVQAQCRSLTREGLESTSEANRGLQENVQEVRAQYDRELLDLLYERDSVPARRAT